MFLCFSSDDKKEKLGVKTKGALLLLFPSNFGASLTSSTWLVGHSTRARSMLMTTTKKYIWELF